MIISISVRDIVSFALQRGSIDTRFVSSSRAVQGTKIHQKLQKESIENNCDYQKEVYLSLEFKFDDFSINVDGRADGVIFGDEIIVEEIKSTSRDFTYIDKDYNEMHWAQVKFYAYILCRQRKLHTIKIRLIYYSIVTDEVKTFEEECSFDYLEEYIFNIVGKFKAMAELDINLKSARNESIVNLQFPFDSYRKGQREMSVSIYNTIREGKDIFIKAPTGIGKTISTMFPALKSISKGITDKIFYLTSKTITKTVAEDTIKLLHRDKLKIKSCSIVAKDKICFMEERRCNPDYCKYAECFYDKLNENLINIINDDDIFTREVIEARAKQYEMCPFELSLEIAKWCDVIICDYNYIFDSSVALKYLFEESNDKKVLLIDEAHNLVSRSRMMYSSELRKGDILKLKKIVKGKIPSLSSILTKINSEFISLRREAEENEGEQHIIDDVPSSLIKQLKLFMREADTIITKNQGVEGIDDITDVYFKINKFLNTVNDLDSCYINYIDTSDKDVVIVLFCIDTSTRLSSKMKNAHSNILFSATLSPMNYYISLIGGGDDSYRMFLESPFDRDNLCLNAINISTKYRNREKTLTDISDLIHDICKKKKGNYIVFFPSYKYMMSSFEYFSDKYDDIEFVMQKNDMRESEREEFLKSFDKENDKTMIAFCVIGGIFSEGIDLTGDKLIGVIVVGVGLPQICFQRDIIKNYYNEKGFSGYDYSYTYPGINKVLQAVGRTIRTENDRGIAVLIDERYFETKYRNLMPKEWSNINMVRDKNELLDNIEGFWNE